METELDYIERRIKDAWYNDRLEPEDVLSIVEAIVDYLKTKEVEV